MAVKKHGGWNKGKRTGHLITPRNALDKEALSVQPYSIVAEARTVLGKRYREYGGSMWLDGKPSTVGEVIRAANGVLVRVGGSQLGRNPEWHINT